MTWVRFGNHNSDRFIQVVTRARDGRSFFRFERSFVRATSAGDVVRGLSWRLGSPKRNGRRPSQRIHHLVTNVARCRVSPLKRRSISPQVERSCPRSNCPAAGKIPFLPGLKVERASVDSPRSSATFHSATRVVLVPCGALPLCSPAWFPAAGVTPCGRSPISAFIRVIRGRSSESIGRRARATPTHRVTSFERMSAAGSAA
jgi:hypothetical protein